MYSNCFLEAIKQYILNSTSIIIYKRGSWWEIFQCKWPHFYWLNKEDNKHYHFCANFTDETFLHQLWFEGDIKRFLWHDKSTGREVQNIS